MAARDGLGLMVLSRLFLGADQLAVDQAFGDLNRVQRGALAQIVRDAPQYQAVFHGRVLADAADVGRVLARRLVWRDVAARLALVHHQPSPRTPQLVPPLLPRPP